MGTTHLLVGNPTAQSGKNAERMEAALKLLADRGITATLLETLPHGRTIDAVRGALRTARHEVVIAMGGDGTFREVASGVLASERRDEVAVGLLPTGTANDQGKSFGLDAAPTALARNVDVIARRRETRLDAGIFQADGQAPTYFFDSAGWGFSARVLAQRNKDRRTVAAMGPLDVVYRDHAVYAGALVRTFLESYVVPDKMTVILVRDGQREELTGLSDLVIKNTSIYAGAWVFDRTARHDDGRFEIVPFRGKRDWASKAIVDLDGNPVTEAMLNEIGIEHSHPMRGSTFELTFSAPEGGAPLAAQLDGEEWPATPHVRVEVLPRALRVIVPEEAT
jgi:diacylglycerol kinase family enzyme